MRTKTLGDATINVETYSEDLGGEFSGECRWSVLVSDLRRIFARFPKLETEGAIPDAIGDAVENSENGAESFSDLEADDPVTFPDADAGIMLLRAMAEIGGDWSVTWYGENEMWFFHDWDHATHDCTVTNGIPSIYVDDAVEERALINGARNALLSGVPIGDVCEALAKSTGEYENRFGYAPTDLFFRTFHGLKLVQE